MTDRHDGEAGRSGRRGIQKWHFGKLIILWTWGALLAASSLYIVVALPPEWFRLGTTLLLISVVIPAGLSIITWRWLTGRE